MEDLEVEKEEIFRQISRENHVKKVAEEDARGHGQGLGHVRRTAQRSFKRSSSQRSFRFKIVVEKLVRLSKKLKKPSSNQSRQYQIKSSKKSMRLPKRSKNL